MRAVGSMGTEAFTFRLKAIYLQLEYGLALGRLYD